jgi:hypothetical protein
MSRLRPRFTAAILVFVFALGSTALPGSHGPQNAHASAAAQSPSAGFSYASIWYAHIYIGDAQHIQLQARDHVKHGIWVIVNFASSLKYAYYESTDANGFWSKEFAVPADSIGAHSAEAVVTFQLWYGDTTSKDFLSFTPLVRPQTLDAIVSTISGFSVAVGKGEDATAKGYLTGDALSEANEGSVLQVLGLPGRPSVYLYNVLSYTDLEASAKVTYKVSGTDYVDQFQMVYSGGWKISEISPVT